MPRARLRVSEERVAAGLPTPETLVAACNMLGDCKNFQVRRETPRIREYIREYSLKKKPRLCCCRPQPLLGENFAAFYMQRLVGMAVDRTDELENCSRKARAPTSDPVPP